MPTNKLTRCLWLASLCWGAALLPAAAQTLPTQTGAHASAATVEALLRAENNSLVAVSAPVSARPSPAGKTQPQRLQMEVLSIYGPADKLKADVVSGGQSLKGIHAGSRVGSCTVRLIADRCVVFEALERAKPARCPSACWTGKSALAAAVGGAAGSPLPQPFPGASAAAR